MVVCHLFLRCTLGHLFAGITESDQTFAKTNISSITQLYTGVGISNTRRPIVLAHTYCFDRPSDSAVTHVNISTRLQHAFLREYFKFCHGGYYGILNFNFCFRLSSDI